MGKQPHSFGESLRSWPSATGTALIRPSELADKVSRWLGLGFDDEFRCAQSLLRALNLRALNPVAIGG
jgi:hypothetical protein